MHYSRHYANILLFEFYWGDQFLKICLTCSAGGHLSEILQLKRIFSKYNHYFVTFKRYDTEELKKNEKAYFVERPGRNPLKFIVNFFQSLVIFLREKPDLVISIGADVTVPTCYLAKLFGKKIIFIESFCRTKSPSLSGRLIYPIADLFIVQWEGLEKFYKKSVLGGPIF
ncbi:MAG: PssD/Cps14F family polysaccharide biosynthesis glycosyltransferase [Candidatus Diapherotrites archaeon]